MRVMFPCDPLSATAAPAPVWTVSQAVVRGQEVLPRQVACVRAEALEPGGDAHLQAVAEAIPSNADCIMVVGQECRPRIALRFANVCTKPVWLRRPDRAGTVYLPLARFDRLLTTTSAYASSARARPGKRADFPFDRLALRSIAAGTLRSEFMGSYSHKDLMQLASLISPQVQQVFIHDRDCPPEFAQRLADHCQRPVVAFHECGRRLYGPRTVLERVFPLTPSELNALGSVESGMGWRHSFERRSAGVGFESQTRIQAGRLTAQEIGDASLAQAVALAVTLPEALHHVRILAPQCPEAFAQGLADAAGKPVWHGEREFAPAPRDDDAAAVRDPALAPGPRLAALTREEKLWQLFVRHGNLLKEDLDGYAMDIVPRLVEAMDPQLRTVAVHDPDCPLEFLRALADAAGKPVLHGWRIVLPSALAAEPRSNLAVAKLGREWEGRSQEELRRDRSLRGRMKEEDLQALTPEGLAELATLIGQDAGRPYLWPGIPRKVAQRMCDTLGVMLRWGRERLMPDPARRRLFDSSSLVPDGTQLDSWEAYRARMEAIAAHYAAQGVPVRIEYLAQQEGKPPALHLVIGKGSKHHFNTSGVHPNETHSLTADVHDAEWWCRNAYLLEENDLTIHYYCFSPEYLELNEDGLIGPLDPYRYVDHMVRSTATTAYPSHGFSYADEAFRYDAQDPSVIAFCELVDEILTRGHRILSTRSGHNSHFDDVVAMFYVLGREMALLSRFAAALEAATADRGFEVRTSTPENAAQCLVPGASIVFERTRAADLRAQGKRVGMTDTEYLETRALESGNPHHLSVVPELVKWLLTRLPEAMTAAQAQVRKSRLLGELPVLVIQAGECLARHVQAHPERRKDHVVAAALAATGHGEEPTWTAPLSPLCPPSEEDFARTLSPVEAACTVLANSFYSASRAGQVVRALKSCGIESSLADRLRAEMHRVVTDVFEIGRVEDVPVDDAVRLYMEAGNLALQHSLEAQREESLAGR